MAPLYDRFRERRLAQWGLAYVAGAFIALQAMDALEGPLGLSPGFQQAVLIVLLGGLPGALILAWFHGKRGPQKVQMVEVLALSAVVALTVVALLVVPTRGPPSADPGLPTLQRPGLAERTDRGRPGAIAVLPFRELTQGGDFDLSEAVHDEILTHLVQVAGLRPISRTSTLALAGRSLTAPQIADSLGARYILTGSLQRTALEVKVSAALVDPNEDAQLWSATEVFAIPLRGETQDFFQLQEEVARWAVQGVVGVLPGAALGLTSSHAATEDPEAQQAFLDGIGLMTSRTQEGFEGAIEAFDFAIVRDSTFARALSSLALTYALWGHYGYGGEAATYETFGQALAMADRAVQLDPGLADAHATRGYLLTKALAPGDTVEAEFREALRLAPGSSNARILYAGFLAREQRFPESLAQSDTAIDLDPRAPGRDTGLAYNALAAGEFSLALRASLRANRLEPDLQAPKVIRALVHVLARNPEACLEEELGPYQAVRALCLADLGRQVEADELVEEVLDAEGPRNARLHVASYYAWTGAPELALQALERAYDDSPHGLDHRVLSSGIFDPVRRDPDFAAGLAALRDSVWARVQRERDRVRG